jgi:hypothetical protein
MNIYLLDVNNQKELIKMSCGINNKNQISMREIIKNLKQKGFFSERSMIYYQPPNDKMFIFIGYENKVSDYWIELEQDQQVDPIYNLIIIFYISIFFF